MGQGKSVKFHRLRQRQFNKKKIKKKKERERKIKTSDAKKIPNNCSPPAKQCPASPQALAAPANLLTPPSSFIAEHVTGARTDL